MIDYKYLENVYKPYKITKNNNIVIINSTKGKYLVKEKTKDLYSLFSYLESRNYYNYPLLNNDLNSTNNIFEYIDNNDLPLNQKLIELAVIVGSLHNKTIYFKNISVDKIKEVRDTLLNNINYIANYYLQMFLTFIKEEYLSPSKYLFMRNYFKIDRLIKYAREQISIWYDKQLQKNKIRVCIVHNNLSLDHLLISKQNVLTSWDKYLIDTPVIDIINLYKNEYLNVDFNIFLEKYFKIFPFLEEEKKLFFITICILPEIKFVKNEFQNTKLVKKIIIYLNKTESLIRPNNSENNKE